MSLSIRVNMQALMALVGALLAIGSGAPTQRQRLWAPTYYIAAKATYDSRPQEMIVEGASNLPPGASIDILVYDRFRGGSVLNRRQSAVVDKDGLFRVKLQAAEGKVFRHDIMCQLLFMAVTEPPQPAAVLRVVGRHGERLGFPRNPQSGISSGKHYYLIDYVHVI